MPKYDVIIAGAGPAGSTAGYILSRAGLKVLMIDKSVFPREKLCGGLITHKTVRLLERVFGETTGSLKQKNIINYESFRYEFLSRKITIDDRTTKLPFMFVDRELYDNYLLEMAREAGTEFTGGDGVRSLDVLKSEVTTVSGRKFSADIIIGADGANSRVRRSFALDLFGREDWSGDLAAAFEIFVDCEKVKKQFDHPVLYFGYVEWGYAWIFPNRDRLKIGMCALKSKNRKKVVTAFREFLSAMAQGDLLEEKIRTYVLPYGCFLPSPVFKNIMLTGDAAGFADPFMGEGIFYAHRSAELAAQAIMEANQGYKGTLQRAPTDIHQQITARYIELLQEHVYTELIYAGKIRDTVFRYLSKFDYLPFRLAMNIWGNSSVEAVHGLRSYKWMRKKR